MATLNSTFAQQRQNKYNEVRQQVAEEMKTYEAAKEGFNRLDKAYYSILQRRTDAETRYKSLKEKVREMIWQPYMFTFQKRNGQQWDQAIHTGFLYCIPPMDQVKALIEDAIASYLTYAETKPSDKMLRIYINAAELLEESNYSIDSWNAFLERCAFAVAVLETPNRTQAEYNNALSLLIQGFNNLVPVGSLTAAVNQLFMTYALFKNLNLYKYDTAAVQNIITLYADAAENIFEDSSSYSVGEIESLNNDFKMAIENLPNHLLGLYEGYPDQYNYEQLEYAVTNLDNKTIYGASYSSADEGIFTEKPFGKYYVYSPTAETYVESTDANDSVSVNITFDVGDAVSGTIPTPFRAYTGYKYNLPLYLGSKGYNFTKLQHKFLGWYDGSDPDVTETVLNNWRLGISDPLNFHAATNPDNPIAKGFYPFELDGDGIEIVKDYIPEKDTVFTAIWLNTSDKYHKVHYDSYGEIKQPNSPELMNQPDVSENDVFYLKPCYGTVQQASFVGWKIIRGGVVDTDIDNNPIIYKPGDKITMGTENITVRGEWTSTQGGQNAKYKIFHHYDFYRCKTSYLQSTTDHYYRGRIFNFKTFGMPGGQKGIGSNGGYYTLPKYPRTVYSYQFAHDSNYLGAVLNGSTTIADLKNSNSMINELEYVFLGWTDGSRDDKGDLILYQPGDEYYVNGSVTFSGVLISVLDFIYTPLRELMEKTHRFNEYDYTYSSWNDFENTLKKINGELNAIIDRDKLNSYINNGQYLEDGQILETASGWGNAFIQNAKEITYFYTEIDLENAYHRLLRAVNNLVLISDEYKPINASYVIRILDFHYHIQFYDRTLAEVVADMLTKYFKGDVVMNSDVSPAWQTMVNPYVVVKSFPFIVNIHSSLLEEADIIID